MPSPPVFITTPPQGWATHFAGSRTTCHHSCSTPANQLPMGSPPSAQSACPLPSLAFQLHKGNQHIPPSGLPAAPMRVSESSLGAASMVPLPAWSPALCQKAVCPALQGSSPGAPGTHVTKPPPLLALPHNPPQHVSPWAPGPAPSCGYSSVLCAPSQPWNAGCPTALPLHPISLHQHPPGDFTMLVALNAICMPTTPSPP